MNDKSSNSKRKAASEESEFIQKRIKQEEPEPVDNLIGGENELTVEFEAFENGIKEEREEEETNHNDIKIQPSDQCYELAKFYISKMDHKELVAIVHKHIDTLRQDHTRNRDIIETDLQKEHWKIENMHRSISEAFAALIKLALSLDDENSELKKKIVTLVRENPESSETQKQWIKQLQLEDKSEKSRKLREELNVLRMINVSKSREDLDRQINDYFSK